MKWNIARACRVMAVVLPSNSKPKTVEHLEMPIPNPEIDNIERQLGVTLPGMYRKLLVELGPGNGPFLTQIYHPNEIRELYEPFFDDPSQLFAPYFPFGCDNQKQELWVIDADRELAASIWHETVPDDWLDENWFEYDEWIRRFLEPIYSKQ
jgi:hypothetical protein